jgi:leader peptidase (prepilin peptidase)/N-methyltransferase
MSDHEPETEAAFPDVRMKPRMALALTAALAAIFAILFIVLGAATRGDGLALYASFGLGAALLILSYLDLRTGLLLDVITLPLIVLGVGYAMASDGNVWLAILGAILGYGMIAGLGYLWRRMRGYEGIGLGDAKLLAAGGAWVGAGFLPVILLVASGFGMMLAVIVSQKTHGDGDRAAIPFGPPLSLGIWVAWCIVETIPI